MSQIIRAKRLLTDNGWLEDHQLHIVDNNIAAIEPIPSAITQRDAELLCPAYIDTHVHGANGVDVMDDSPDALAKISLFKAREGVGAWLATTVTAPLDEIKQTLARIAQYCQQQDNSKTKGAEVLGCYLEGPYFTPLNKGAHQPKLFRELDVAELDALINVSNNTLKVVALAPEKPNALRAIRHLKARNIRVMLGHSAANYQQAVAAFSAGADGLVHCFNGMTGLHHREPGMVGAGLTDTNAWLELIADGHHVHFATMRLACQCGANRIVLITDAMRAAGMPDGHYAICGYDVQMRDGIVRTPSGGLAGSTLSLDAAVRVMVNDVGIATDLAIRMASLHPAKLLGIDDRYGSLAVGKKANIIALTKDLFVQSIWVNGLLVY